MESLLKADIFFFVTTIAIIILTGICVVVLVYLIKILKDVRHISQKIRDESENIVEDVREFRKTVRSEGVTFMNTVRFIGHFIKPKRRRRTRRTKKDTK